MTVTSHTEGKHVNDEWTEEEAVKLEDLKFEIYEARYEVLKARRSCSEVRPKRSPASLLGFCQPVPQDMFLSGVYLLLRQEQVVYVGQSSNIAARVGQHRGKSFDRAVFLPLPIEDLLAVEGALIRAFQPEYNSAPGAFAGDDESILAKFGLEPHSPAYAVVVKAECRLKSLLDKQLELQRTVNGRFWEKQKAQAK